jgi:hypothetical protein
MTGDSHLQREMPAILAGGAKEKTEGAKVADGLTQILKERIFHRNVRRAQAVSAGTSCYHEARYPNPTIFRKPRACLTPSVPLVRQRVRLLCEF